MKSTWSTYELTIRLLSIPIAFRIPICRRRFTVLMKITMKITTVAITSETPVEIRLMIANDRVTSPMIPCAFSCQVLIVSWTPNA